MPARASLDAFAEQHRRAVAKLFEGLASVIAGWVRYLTAEIPALESRPGHPLRGIAFDDQAAASPLSGLPMSMSVPTSPPGEPSGMRNP